MLLLLFLSFNLTLAVKRSALLLIEDKENVVNTATISTKINNSGNSETEPDLNNHHNIPRENWESPYTPAAATTSNGGSSSSIHG